MDITTAYEILHRYYSKDKLDNIYKTNRFDSSESDTIKKHRLNSELLLKLSDQIIDEKEIKDLIAASDTFENLSNTEFWNC